MPIYEFLCEQCHKKQEMMMKISDPLPTACPLCGGGPFQKLISQTSFVLKGGGWYSQGYSSEKKPADKPAASETKAEAKPAEKPAESAPAPKKDT